MVNWWYAPQTVLTHFIYLCIYVLMYYLFIYLMYMGVCVLILYLCIVPVDVRRYQITWNWSDRQ